MVVAQALESYFNEMLERRRERLRQEGIEQGMEKGREATLAEIRAWYRRQQEALGRGEPFDEPPPGI